MDSQLIEVAVLTAVFALCVIYIAQKAKTKFFNKSGAAGCSGCSGCDVAEKDTTHLGAADAGKRTVNR